VDKRLAQVLPWEPHIFFCDDYYSEEKKILLKMSRKGKQCGVDIKQEDVLQAVVRKTLIG
jgi:hypothetical protein